MYSDFTEEEVSVILSKNGSAADKCAAVVSAAQRNAETVNDELGWLADNSGSAVDRVEVVSRSVFAKVLTQVQEGAIPLSLVGIVESLLEEEDAATTDYWAGQYANSLGEHTMDEDDIYDAYSDNPAKRYTMLNELE